MMSNEVPTMMIVLHASHLHRDFYDVLRVVFFLLVLNKDSWSSYAVNCRVVGVACGRVWRWSVEALGSLGHISNDHFSQDEKEVALGIRGAVCASNGTAATLNKSMKKVKIIKKSLKIFHKKVDKDKVYYLFLTY